MAKKFDYNAYIKGMSGWALDYDDEAERIAEDGAYDAAKSIVEDEPQVTKYLKSIGVTDIIGRVADDLHSVALIETDDDDE